MASPNINMRDPVLFRIMNVPHYRQGSKWVIYPMYDYAHPISDAIENLMHSLCMLELEDHSPLYDWCLEKLPVPSGPVQIEFARLNLSYTVLFFFQAEDGIRDGRVTGVQTCALPISESNRRPRLCRPLHDHSAIPPAVVKREGPDRALLPGESGLPFRIWSGKRVSNSRPQPWQGCALPTELFPRKGRIISRAYPCMGQRLAQV